MGDLTFKDFAVVIVSGCALLVSLLVAFFTIRAASEKRVDDARNAFDEALTGVQTARSDYEALRHELGDEFNEPAAYGRRVLIADRRNFYLSRAMTALEGERFAASGWDHLLIAAALIDSGRTGAAIPHYARAVTHAADLYERSNARRVLGRALILAGDTQRGRSEMHQAAADFEDLANDAHYDALRMEREGAETLRRLVEVEMIAGLYDEVMSDASALRSILPRLDYRTSTACEVTLERSAEWLETHRQDACVEGPAPALK